MWRVCSDASSVWRCLSPEWRDSCLSDCPLLSVLVLFGDPNQMTICCLFTWFSLQVSNVRCWTSAMKSWGTTTETSPGLYFSIWMFLMSQKALVKVNEQITSPLLWAQYEILKAVYCFLTDCIFFFILSLAKKYHHLNCNFSSLFEVSCRLARVEITSKFLHLHH